MPELQKTATHTCSQQHNINNDINTNRAEQQWQQETVKLDSSNRTMRLEAASLLRPQQLWAMLLPSMRLVAVHPLYTHG